MRFSWVTACVRLSKFFGLEKVGDPIVLDKEFLGSARLVAFPGGPVESRKLRKRGSFNRYSAKRLLCTSCFMLRDRYCNLYCCEESTVLRSACRAPL